MTDLIASESGILYPSPSKETDPIVLEGDGWVVLLYYHGWHPMLPRGLDWHVRLFTRKSEGSWERDSSQTSVPE